VNHLTTLSALQLHPWPLIVADEDATAGVYIILVALNVYITSTPFSYLWHHYLVCFFLSNFTHRASNAELRVKTVKYFKSIERVQDEVEATHRALAKGKEGVLPQVGQMD
jgi:glucosamine-6-phosphate deaminase